MSRTIITNGTVLTLDEADTVHFGGSVTIEGDRIARVDPAAPEAIGPDDEVIDAPGQIVMPGLIDLHYHTALGKGWSDHLPLWEYLQTCWYPMIRALDPEAAYWAALASYGESIRCGVTTVNDMYRQLEALGDAAERIGIRAVLSNDVATDEHDLDTLADNEAAFRAKHGAAGGRIEVRVGIEWLPLASEELLRDARVLADELGHGHPHPPQRVAQRGRDLQADVRAPADRGRLRLRHPGARLHRRALRLAVRRRDRPDARDRDADLAQPELERQARQRRGAAARDAGRRPQRRARPRRGRVQQQPRHVRGDEVRLAAAPRGPRRRRAAAGPGRAAHGDAQRRRGRSATRPASSSAGRKADVILVDTNSTMFTPLMPGSRDHAYSHLVFAANGSCVDTTIVDGQVVMRDRTLLTVDEDEVIREANRAFREVVGRMVVPDLTPASSARRTSADRRVDAPTGGRSPSRRPARRLRSARPASSRRCGAPAGSPSSTGGPPGRPRRGSALRRRGVALRPVRRRSVRAAACGASAPMRLEAGPLLRLEAGHRRAEAHCHSRSAPHAGRATAPARV